MAFCRKCGFELVSDANNCVECGSPIGVVEKYVISQKPISKQQKKSKKVFIFVVIAFLAGAIFGGFFVGFAKPQLISARKQINKKKTIKLLMEFGVDQEIFKTENATYGTIERVSVKGKTNIVNAKNGYKFSDLIITPTTDNWAVIASPVNWGVDGERHYIITNTGIVREYDKIDLPFKTPNFGFANSLHEIEKLKPAQ